MDKKHDESSHMMSHKMHMYNQKNEKTKQERREYYEKDLKDKTMLKNVMSKIAEDDFKLMKHKLEMNEMLESQAERKVIREQRKAFDAQEEEHYHDEEREMIDRDAIVSAHRAEEVEQRQKSNANTSAAVEANEVGAKGYPPPHYYEFEKKFKQYDTDRKEGVKQASHDDQDGLIRQVQYKVDSAENESMQAEGYPPPHYYEYEKKYMQYDIDRKEGAEQASRDNQDGIKKKYMQDDIDRKEGVKQAGRDNQDGLIWQMKYKVDFAEKGRVLDAAFYKSNEEKMFENDEEERLNKLKNKEIQMQYGEDLRQQILENASRRKREHEAENKRDSNANAAKWGWSASERVRDVQEYDKA